MYFTTWNCIRIAFSTRVFEQSNFVSWKRCKVLFNMLPSTCLSFRNAPYLSERKQIEKRPDFKTIPVKKWRNANFNKVANQLHIKTNHYFRFYYISTTRFNFWKSRCCFDRKLDGIHRQREDAPYVRCLIHIVPIEMSR